MSAQPNMTQAEIAIQVFYNQIVKHFPDLVYRDLEKARMDAIAELNRTVYGWTAASASSVEQWPMIDSGAVLPKRDLRLVVNNQGEKL